MRHFFAGMFIFAASALFAQAEKTTVWVLPLETDGGPNSMPFAKEARSEIIEAFIKFGSFSVVDRDVNGLINKELELQKTEAFMDGKVVEQGKGMGAEYIAQGYFFSKENRFSLRIVEVASGNVTDKEEYKLDFFSLNYKKHLKGMVFRLAGRWLSSRKISVLRTLEDKNGSAVKLLVAGGSNKGLKVGTSLEFFAIETVDVEGEEMERFAFLGKGKVDQIENANFSNAKIKSGGKEVFDHLAQGKKLYCRPVLK